MASDEKFQPVPKARAEGLSIQELGNEILIYDRDTDQAHCLGPVAARVWRACDGKRPLADLGDDAEVTSALVELADKGLVVERDVAGGSGISRRQLVGRMAAAAVATPVILSVTAPRAEAVGSCVAHNATCTPGGTGIHACCAGDTCKESPKDSGNFVCK